MTLNSEMWKQIIINKRSGLSKHFTHTAIQYHMMLFVSRINLHFTHRYNSLDNGSSTIGIYTKWNHLMVAFDSALSAVSLSIVRSPLLSSLLESSWIRCKHHTCHGGGKIFWLHGRLSKHEFFAFFSIAVMISEWKFLFTFIYTV